MLKPHLARSTKTSTQLKFKATLLKASKGLFAAAMICACIFLMQMLGNTASTKASGNNFIHLKLSPVKSKNNTGISADAEISYSADSLFVVFKFGDKTELKNAFLYFGAISEGDVSTGPIKTVTLTDAKKMSDQSYRFAVALATLPEKLMIEAHASLKTDMKADATNAKDLTEYISRVKFNRTDFSFLFPPAELNANNITAKTATLCWVPVTAAYKYRIRYRKSGDTEWKMGTVTAPGAQRPVVNLQPSNSYEFQVQAYLRNQIIDSTGYSILASFTTEPETFKSVTAY